MSETIPPIDPGVEAFLRLFFPQYFDPASPSYVDPATMAALSAIAADSRPWCLSEKEQDLAQAFFTSYLITLQQETSSGRSNVVTAGPIISEKEGDIAVTYAAVSTNTANNMSKRPPSDPWDAWNRLFMRCGKGAIITRFGEPCQQTSESLTKILVSRALQLT